MFIGFLHQLKEAGVPVSIREYLDFLSGLDKGITNLNTNSFYHFARASLVKDERHYDRFDRTFSEFFEGSLKKGERFLIIFQKSGSKMLYKRILLKKIKKK